MEKDYIKIVLDGFINPNTRKRLSDYFYRQWKQAEAEHYSKIEFMEGCASVVTHAENNLNHFIENEKRELKSLIYDPYFQTFSHDEQLEKKEMLEGLDKRENFSIPLADITNGQYRGDLEYTDLYIILKSLHSAMLRDEPQQENKQPDQLIIPISTKAAEYLYNELVKLKYIPNDNWESFKYVFCGGKKPDQFKKIKWMASVELLRVFLEARKPADISMNVFRNKVANYFVNKKNEPRRLPKPKKYDTIEKDKMIEISKKIENI